MDAFFAATTLVCTPDGFTPIWQVRPADLVLDRRGFVPPTSTRYVISKFARLDRVWAVRLGSGVIHTTEQQSFHAVGTGWKMACSLKPGDMLSGLTGPGAAVESVVRTDRVEAVHNIEVSPGSTYLVMDESRSHSVWVQHRWGN